MRFARIAGRNRMGLSSKVRNAADLKHLPVLMVVMLALRRLHHPRQVFLV
jgi:hypothetical protein